MKKILRGEKLRRFLHYIVVFLCGPAEAYEACMQ